MSSTAAPFGLSRGSPGELFWYAGPDSRLAQAERLRRLAALRARPWYARPQGRAHGTTVYEAVKRIIDVVVAACLLPFAIPIIGLCALLIKLDSPGPALMAQPRTGLGGHRFRMYKLRTMVQNAHELKARYMHLNERSYPDFKITNDPRLTRCGRVLRKLSLDELPQLVNVLRGEMTLVGPRPTSFGAETYHLWQTARLDVKPGLTGLWQVNGRADLDFDERLRLDIVYIRHRCLELDLLILVRTVGAVLSRKGAH